MQDRVLARVTGVVLSRFYEAEHRARGVDVRLGIALDYRAPNCGSGSTTN